MLAEKLISLRENHDIYQKELAAYLNVSVATISNYEKGVHEPNMETLCKLADFYNVSTDYLLGRTPNPLPGSQLSPQQPQALADLFLDLSTLSRKNISIVRNFAHFLHNQELRAKRRKLQ